MISKQLNNIIKSQSKIAEILRYGFTGVIATLLQIILYFIFVKYCDAPLIVAVCLSYGLSFLVNFVLSNYFTFRTKPNLKKGFAFTVSHLFNLGLQTSLITVFGKLVTGEYAIIPVLAICIPINFIFVRLSLTSKWVQTNH